MNRIHRSRALHEFEAAADQPNQEDCESQEEDEPEYAVLEEETVQDAQDRIEEKYRLRATSPLRAIRAFCVLCMGAQPKEVAKCTATKCVLYPMRFGTNPYQKRNQGDG